MDTAQLHQLLAANPADARRRHRLALRIAARGASDVGHVMDVRSQRPQYQSSDVRFLGFQPMGSVPGTYPTTSRRHARPVRIADTTTHATMAISYPASAARFFTRHSATFYYDAACNGTGFARMDAYAILLQAARE